MQKKYSHLNAENAEIAKKYIDNEIIHEYDERLSKIKESHDCNNNVYTKERDKLFDTMQSSMLSLDEEFCKLQNQRAKLKKQHATCDDVSKIDKKIKINRVMRNIMENFIENNKKNPTFDNLVLEFDKSLQYECGNVVYQQMLIRGRYIPSERLSIEQYSWEKQLSVAKYALQGL